MFKRLFAIGILTVGILAGGFQVTYAQDTMNCGDFASKQEVMDFWYNNNYSADNDPHNLDGDKDGFPCEVTAGEYDVYVNEREYVDSGQGGELPNTATNNPMMMLAGAVMVAFGALFFIRRKQQN